MLKLANFLNGGHDGSHLPTYHKSSVHIRPDVRLKKYIVLIIPLLDCEVRPLFSQIFGGQFSRLLHHAQRLSNWLNLSISERSYGIEFWPFLGQNLSLGDSHHQAWPFSL